VQLTDQRTERRQPDVVGVLEANVTARSDQADELVVVIRERVQVVDVVVEVTREPDIFLDDLVRRLGLDTLIVLVLANTPACTSASAAIVDISIAWILTSITTGA
jgi:hypothetical protein